MALETIMEKLAQTLHAAWRNAQDLAPMTWEQLSEPDRSVWLSVAAAVPAPEPAKRK